MIQMWSLLWNVVVCSCTTMLFTALGSQIKILRLAVEKQRGWTANLKMLGHVTVRTTLGFCLCFDVAFKIKKKNTLFIIIQLLLHFLLCLKLKWDFLSAGNNCDLPLPLIYLDHLPQTVKMCRSELFCLGLRVFSVPSVFCSSGVWWLIKDRIGNLQ